MFRPPSRQFLTYLARGAIAAALLVAAAPKSSAQVPKIGDYYTDASDLGFRVKVPKDWKFIPPQPGDMNLIGKYDPAGEKGIQVKKGQAYWPYAAWLLRFDRRKPKDDAKPDEIRFGPAATDLFKWTESTEIGIKGNFKKSSEAKLAIPGVNASEYTFDGQVEDTPVRLYAALYRLNPELEIALVFNGPGDDKKWAKFEGPFKTMAKSFKLLAMEAKAGGSATGASLRDAKRAELKDLVVRQPGWGLYETENYFVLSNNTDLPFLEELKMRLEAIRKVYEETYPPSKAEELRKLAETARAKRAAEEASSGKKEKEKEGEGEGEDEDEPRTEALEPPGDPMEASRTSVVRVVQNEEQYRSYGGPPGSAGYWSPAQQELVIFDDKAEGGRRNTWATLNHEAFHQYIFYFFGNLAPHSWYNEGTGDFYSGYQLRNQRFELSPFDWRVDLIKEVIREEQFVPLDKFVKLSKDKYYGVGSPNQHEVAGHNYAQGWSFIWFLRTGPKKAKCWNRAWDPILDTYLRVLVETDDLDQAVNQAFAGVDWAEMEECWKTYIKKG
jgi:hypothetical protein